MPGFEDSTRRTAALLAAICLLHVALLVQLLHRGTCLALDVEEGFPAFVAHELLQPGGPHEPPTTYLYEQYQGGTLFVGWLATPLFAAFGPSLFALKLVSLGLSVATLLAVWALATQLYGRPVGLIAAALLAIGPPAWLVRGTQTLGDTTEMFPVLLLAAWAVARAAAHPGRLRAGLAGLLCGASLAFSLAALPALVLLGAAALAHARRWRPPAVAVLGLGVGLAVPLYNAWVHEVAFLRWRGHALESMVESPLLWPATALGVLGEPVQRGLAMGLEPGVPGFGEAGGSLLVWRAYWLASLAAGLVVGAFGLHRRDGRDLAVAAVHAAYLAAYVVNPHRVPYLLLLTVPTGALVLARAHQLAGAGRATGAVLGLVALSLLAALAPLAAPVQDAPLYDVPLVDPPRWRWRLPPFGQRWREALPALREDPRRFADWPAEDAFGCGHLLAQGEEPGLLARLAEAHPARARELAEGYGYAHGYEAAPAGQPPAALLASLPRPLGLAAVRGYGRALAERRWLELEHAVAELPRTLDPEAGHQLVHGLGVGFGFRFWHQPRRLRGLEAAFPAAHWPAFLEGLTARLRELVPEKSRQRALMGLAAGPSTSTQPIFVPARRAAAGNLNWAEHTFGAELVVDGGERPAWARYEIEVARPGRYALWIQYAADDARALAFRFDEGPPGTPQDLPSTGGFHAQQLRWIRLGWVAASAGRHAVELSAEGLFPHLAALRLERDE